MERLRELVGAERTVRGVSQVIHLVTAALHAPAVGAMLITCADESETECADAFHRGFVRYVVPPLKFGERAAFRIANLGGRYEWGAVRLAEAHYATPESRECHKLLVVKVNAHVAVQESPQGPHFGVMRRYDSDSACCGALDSLLAGAHLPILNELREAFTSEGKDRLSALLDERVVSPPHRHLFAAIASARLQARRVTLDVQDHRPATPTRYLIMSAVTVNRPEHDTEIVCGYYWAADPDKPHCVEHFGLGDDPAAYRMAVKNGRVVVTDGEVGEPRQARNHRLLVLDEWHRRVGDRRPAIRDERFTRIRLDVEQQKHRDRRHAKFLLSGLLVVLSEVAPVSAAVLLFANGMVGMHHAFRVHRLARELEGSGGARVILDELRDKIDRLDPDHAEAMVELLTRTYQS
jgi:hypothetical protein